MSAKTYRTLTGAIVFALAMLVSLSLARSWPSYVLIVGLAIAMASIRLLQQLTREVMVDERVKRLNEKASAISFRIFTIVVAIVALGLVVFRGESSETMKIAGETLAFAVCGLMLLHLLAVVILKRRM